MHSEEEQIFLTYPFEGYIPEESKQKILLFKFMQYGLWLLLAKVKEQYDNNFEKYDIHRFKNAYQFMHQYQEQYEK
ncbi:hypothetical protein [Candidatus Williamhamiltonella defendens]|uniref:hypothetical protein n=1 Tax=Candidatus Williamhamiltonella defendens TaxID=138072 RepID=UPI001F4875CE|nr:hypothetical protein [Candidatus Hamiltonella defensa]